MLWGVEGGKKFEDSIQKSWYEDNKNFISLSFKIPKRMTQRLLNEFDQDRIMYCTMTDNFTSKIGENPFSDFHIMIHVLGTIKLYRLFVSIFI